MMRFQIRPAPGLAFTLPLIALIAMQTEEPEMLHTDALCEHTMQQQTATAAGTLLRYTAFPDHL